jgi:hypothetical protein
MLGSNRRLVVLCIRLCIAVGAAVSGEADAWSDDQVARLCWVLIPCRTILLEFVPPPNRDYAMGADGYARLAYTCGTRRRVMRAGHEVESSSPPC